MGKGQIMVIRKLDKYNFILAEELEEPMMRTIGDKEIVYNYKNLPLHSNDIYYAIRALVRHSKCKIKLEDIPKSLLDIKPDDEQDRFMPFLEVTDDQILKVIEKEY